MNIGEISANNRLEIEYLTDDSYKRNLRGIVLSVTDKDINFITEMGDRLSLSKTKILAVDRISFEKNISESLTLARGYYQEIETLENRLKELNGQKSEYILKLLDSRILSKYNDEGVVNLFNEWFDKKGKFRIGDSFLELSFSNSENEGEIYITITSKKSFEFFDTEDKEELTRAIETYAPNKKTEIATIFPIIKDILSKKRYVERINDYLFNAVSIYEGILTISKENLVDTRDTLENIIGTIRKVGEV